MDNRYKCTFCGWEGQPEFTHYPGERSEGVAVPDYYSPTCPMCGRGEEYLAKLALCNVCTGEYEEDELHRGTCARCAADAAADGMSLGDLRKHLVTNYSHLSDSEAHNIAVSAKDTLISELITRSSAEFVKLTDKILNSIDNVNNNIKLLRIILEEEK